MGADKPGKPKGTKRLDLGQRGYFEAGPFEDTTPFDDGNEAMRVPWVLELTVVETGSVIRTQVKDSLTVGRGSGRGVNEIDLSEYNAAQLGVSRLHALMLAQRRYLSIRDMDSTNGTYINGLRLMPQQDVPLEHGDELGFGQLLVRVSYSIVPPNKLATPEKTDTASLATVNTQGDGHRVIIADANAEIAIIYQLILAEQGYHVTVTASAREAAQVLKEAMPSVLVMDWATTEATAKGTDAPGAIRLLRQYAAKAGKPLGIGVICQEGDTQAAEEAERSGAAFVLSKPVHASELLQGVAQAVNRSGGNVTA